MGCDIHAVLVTEKDGKFEIVKTDVIPDRNYVLFGALAGVRSNVIRPLEAAHGRVLSKGLDELFPYDGDKRSTADGSVYIGDHSFTYLSRRELVKLRIRIEDEMPKEIVCCCPCHKDDEDAIAKWENTEEIEDTEYVLDILDGVYFDMVDLQGESDDIYLVMGFDS